VYDAKILIVDDEKNILSSLKTALSIEGFTVTIADSASLALQLMKKASFDLVLLDVKMPGIDGMSFLKTIKEREPALPVIMMSGHGTISTALEAIKLGAIDFIEKPLSSERLIVTISNVLRIHKLQRENQELKFGEQHKYQLVGSSKSMLDLMEKVKITSGSNSRVLVLGENGTGKELVARAIHALSDRSDEAFIKVNCAAIPDELIESELFGHVKGAFTGAMAARKGKFTLANGGTIFLDEIGDMKLEMQSKLLRVLQEGEFEPVGGEETISVDVRVISATNRNLEELIEKDQFRQDLYYRLAVIPLAIPPLRERLEDIEELVDHFISQVCTEYNRPSVHFDEGAISLLKTYTWPGNVRELKNTIERLIILNSKSQITADEVAPVVNFSKSAGGEIPVAGKPLRDLVGEYEKKVIEKALERNLNNVTNTARELDLERSHLYKKMKAYDIKPRD
jgi:two-component system nitrogen regulation response regulator NtrX